MQVRHIFSIRLKNIVKKCKTNSKKVALSKKNNNPHAPRA